MSSTHRETYYYLDNNGDDVSIRINGKNKRETDLKFQEFLAQNRPKTEVPTLREFVDQVYRPSFMIGLAATTLANYEQYLAKNILPFLGDKQMDRINVATIQQFYNWMARAASFGRRKNLNRCTISRVGGLASRIFKVAFEMGIIPDTPFKSTLLRNNGEPGEHHKALPDNEVDRIKRAIPTLQDERQRLYMSLLVYTGMRKEEILGLQWQNVHLEEGYGEIKTVVVYPDNSHTVIKPMPKTQYSQRTFLIPMPLKVLMEPFVREDGYVIRGENADSPASFSTAQRTYRKAFKALGLTGKYNNHDWRTTFGTQLKESGMSSATVADLMGHADTRMVETIYARTRHEGVMKQQETLDKMNEGYI